MIARHWRGWTAPQNADAYQELLSGTVLPGLKKISGYRGGYVLRPDVAEEVEFVVVNLFDSIEAVPDPTTPSRSSSLRRGGFSREWNLLPFTMKSASAPFWLEKQLRVPDTLR
jgi:antibiotic biosynthesis monooxygenase (ABM) superfamily enzyme